MLSPTPSVPFPMQESTVEDHNSTKIGSYYNVHTPLESALNALSNGYILSIEILNSSWSYEHLFLVTNYTFTEEFRCTTENDFRP